MHAPFANELTKWGPRSGAPRQFSLAEAEAYCRDLASSHYENFPVASRLLPRHLRQHFCNVYAYCRWADDLGDETPDSATALELLAWWREQLQACYRGETTHPVFRALESTIERFAIPIEPFQDLISAFEQDQSVHEYDSFEQLRDYCRRSADPVGRIVLYLSECFSADRAAWSDSICTGLQLANFWQDVSRDFDKGRIYLPRETRRRFGYSDDELQARITNSAFLASIEFEVTRARQFLRAGLPLIEAVPVRLQIDIELFARGGFCILDRIEGIGYSVWDIRPVVTKVDFARLFLQSMGKALLRIVSRRSAALPRARPVSNP